MTPLPGFCGSPLRRPDEAARREPGSFAALVADPRALVLDLEGYFPRVRGDALSWLPASTVTPDELILLGEIDGVPRFAHLAPDAAPARRSPDLFAALDTLRAGEAGTYAAARSLLDWHARHRFCANCGTGSAVADAGWARTCPACGTQHFPRTDPVAIMLAEHGTGDAARILVGRQPAFPTSRYSALAGFIEVGESIEDAVARELHEEAGVVATDIRYIASQPWPFPSQLMIACIAQVESDQLSIDTRELEDARWVDRADVALALASDPAASFLPPPAYAIAHTLFLAWMAEH